MAVTKIHGIKTTLGQAIKYICNEQKTDEKVLISSYDCSPQIADLEFKFLLQKNKSGSPNQAFHLIQSFAPGEVTGEEAHHISQQLADEVLQGKYPYVLATHIDRNHIHSHIIFCAVNNVDYTKYHDCKKTYYKIRNTSDRLCAEHGKSVIKDFKEAGKTYHEWYHYKKGDSWKAQVKKDINECVKKALSYDEFLRLMRDKGYEINGETFGEGSAKYISFRPFGKDRFVRGRANTLGVEYTKERIWERIEEKAKLRAEKMLNGATSSGTGNAYNRSNSYHGISTNYIDTNTEKMKENPALEKWADKNNLKTFASVYAEFGRENIQSKTGRADLIAELQKQIAHEKKSINTIDKEIKQFDEILRYAKFYVDNKKIYNNYENSKDQERYYRNHCTEIELFKASKNWLKNSGIDPATLKIKEIEEHYQKLIADKNTLTASYKAKEQEIEQLKKAEENLYKFLDEPRKDRPVSAKKRDRNISL